MMRSKVIVVEGKNDLSRLKQIYPDMFILTTNGSEILDETLTALKQLDETHDIILFLDPDYAGQRIRSRLEKQLTHVSHAFLDKEKAISRNHKKIGIEHATTEDIIMSLKNVYHYQAKKSTDIDMAFLYDTKLIGHKDSQKRREILSKILHLGHVNGKTLLERLHAFNIYQKNVCEVIECNIKQKKDLDKTF